MQVRRDTSALGGKPNEPRMTSSFFAYDEGLHRRGLTVDSMFDVGY